MSKHPIDHDHGRDNGKVAQRYSRIEREQADELTDPKVRAMIKGERGDTARSTATKLESYLNIDRKVDDS